MKALAQNNRRTIMPEPPITLAKCIMAITFVLFAVLLVGMVSAPAPVDPYCEMVGIWTETGGEFGWPDYRGNGECGNER